MSDHRDLAGRQLQVVACLSCHREARDPLDSFFEALSLSLSLPLSFSLFFFFLSGDEESELTLTGLEDFRLTPAAEALAAAEALSSARLTSARNSCILCSAAAFRR